MAGWFELSKSSDNQFRFVLKAGNGETILTSELYTSKASAEKGIASVRSVATARKKNAMRKKRQVTANSISI